MMTRAPIPPSQISGALDFLAVLRLIVQNPEEVQSRLQELAEAQAEQAARADELRAQAAELEKKTAAAAATIDEADAAMADVAAARDAAAADNARTATALKQLATDIEATEKALIVQREEHTKAVADAQASFVDRIVGIDRREAELSEKWVQHARIVEAELQEITNRKALVAADEKAVAEAKAEIEAKLEKMRAVAASMS